MNEKAYKTMSLAGAANIAIGVVTLVIGVVVGTVAIICGAQLIKNKKGLTF